MRPRRQKQPDRAVADEPAIEWREYDRIEPGEYRAYCRSAKHYHDLRFKRWTCLLRFVVLSNDLLCVLARVAMWMNLGKRDRPHAGRGSRYFKEWVRAHGGPPARRDRLSPTVFKRRMAHVQIADTKGQVPYSKVSKIIAWETG